MSRWFDKLTNDGHIDELGKVVFMLSLVFLFVAVLLSPIVDKTNRSDFVNQSGCMSSCERVGKG